MTLGELSNLIDAAKQWQVFDASEQLSVRDDSKWVQTLKWKIHSAKSKANWLEREEANQKKARDREEWL